jgi:hypothetical protein
LAFSYWIDIPWFHTEGKLAAIFTKTFSWGSQLADHLLHQLHTNKFSGTIHHRAIRYQGVSLDQLKDLHEGGLDGVDRVRLRQRSCAIAECANTNEFFNAGEGGSDESLDDADFEEPSFAEALEKATEDPPDGSISQWR